MWQIVLTYIVVLAAVLKVVWDIYKAIRSALTNNNEHKNMKCLNCPFNRNQ